jgi:hypothetical protein
MKDSIDTPEFTDEQLQAALRDVGAEARQAAFAAGKAVIYVKGQTIVALHPDGTEEVVESLSQGIDTSPDAK